MYLYYDKTGKLKEIINDEALRQGNYNANTIYVYVEEKQDSINYIRVNYLLPSDLIVGPQDYNTRESKMIPFDEKRDLEYFKYNTTYNFIKIVMEADENANGPLDMGGLVHCELRAFNLTNQQILKLGTLNFQVELDEVAQQKYIALLPQEYMSLSDYRYLELLIGNGIGYIKLNEGSGTLTDEQIAMVNKDYCILEYDGNLYYKAGYDNLYAYFYRLNVWGSTGNREYRINDNFTITLADGSYSKLNSMQTFYNANVMDGLLPGYIELEDSGYVLTADELTEAAKQHCVINLEGTYYYKAGETEYVYQFYKIPTMAGGSNDTIVFYNTYLPVSKDSGSWHTETSNFTTYKKDKIDTLIGANVGYVELSGSGGSLSDAQITELSKNVAIIEYENNGTYEYYYKQYQANYDEDVAFISMDFTSGRNIKTIMCDFYHKTWSTPTTTTIDANLPSLTDNAGKVLKVNNGATGVEWDSEYKLYAHELTIEDNTHGWDYNITLLSPLPSAFPALTNMLTALTNEKAMFLTGNCMDNGEGEFYVMFGVHYTPANHKLYCSVYNTTTSTTTTISIDDSLDDVFEDVVSQWTA